MTADASDTALDGHYAIANGLKIYYEEHGTGHPLLLLQAGFDTHHIWDSQLPAWKPHFRVITPDSRGLGRTEHPGGQISYELLAQDAIALIQALGLEQPFICGIGDGACVALQMAIWAPELAAAYVLMAAWLWNAKQASHRGLQIMQELFGIDGPVREHLSEDDLDRIERKQHPAVDYLRGGWPGRKGSSDHWRTYLKEVWPAWSTLTEHSAAELQRITAPTLVVVGDRDEFQPVREAAELYHHLPNAELAVIPGMDHFTTVGHRADLLSVVVLDFLRRQVESSPAG
jgi:pimeloyl-ACP methyl ester carboxylesterase